MLTDLFKLDLPVVEFDEAELERHFQTSKDIRSVLFRPDDWPSSALSSIKGVNFTNVSLSKTSIKKVTFTGCTFEDCLFIGTVFEDVEFHGCKFINCNLHKAHFSECYIDPTIFEFDRAFGVSASNMVLHVYHELYKNASDARQSRWAATADFRFRQWQRAQLNYDFKEGRIGRWHRRRANLSSYIYEYSAGFGYRPLRFVLSTLIAFALVSLFNWIAIGDAFTVDGVRPSHLTLVNSIFYSFSMLTALGFSSIVPLSAGAKLLAVGEALLGIGWLGIFTALLVKRFTR